MTKSNWVRNGSIAGMVAVPVLAVALLSTNLFAGFSMPNALISETRDFNLHGQSLAAPAQTSTDESTEVFLGTWQNTIIIPPTPRR